MNYYIQNKYLLKKITLLYFVIYDKNLIYYLSTNNMLVQRLGIINLRSRTINLLNWAWGCDLQADRLREAERCVCATWEPDGADWAVFSSGAWSATRGWPACFARDRLWDLQLPSVARRFESVWSTQALYNRFIRLEQPRCLYRIFVAQTAQTGHSKRLIIDAIYLKAHWTSESQLKRGVSPSYRVDKRQLKFKTPCCMRRSGQACSPASDSRSSQWLRRRRRAAGSSLWRDRGCHWRERLW